MKKPTTPEVPDPRQQLQRMKEQLEAKHPGLATDRRSLRAWRMNVEWERKAIHLLSTILAVWVFFMDEPIASLGLAAATVFVLSVDISRLGSRRWANWLYRRLPFVFRGDERRRWSGASIMMIGCTATSAFFPAGAATAGILCLTWGDSAAALVGQFWKHWRQIEESGRVDPNGAPAVRNRGRKTIAGSLGCLVVSMVMIFLVIGPTWDVVFLGALGATLMERWTHGGWDNLTIPLATAGIIQYSLIWLR